VGRDGLAGDPQEFGEGLAAPGKEEDFWVKGARLHHGASMDSCVPFESASHLLFHVEVRSERDDWMSLKNIQDAYQEALRQWGEGETEKAELAISRAVVLVRTSPDLTRADRNRVALALREDYNQAKGGGEGAIPAHNQTLASVVERRAMPVDQALEEEPSWQKLLTLLP
jgi:hypothetical protein